MQLNKGYYIFKCHGQEKNSFGAEKKYLMRDDLFPKNDFGTVEQKELNIYSWTSRNVVIKFYLFCFLFNFVVKLNRG